MRFLTSIAFVVFASSAQAATVLSVSGDDIDGEIMSTAGIAPNEGVGVSFDVTSDLINAAFALEFECFTDAGCSGLVQWSNTGLGPDSLIRMPLCSQPRLANQSSPRFPESTLQQQHGRCL